jgi:hypothetical protein
MGSAADGVREKKMYGRIGLATYRRENKFRCLCERML